MRMKEHLTDQLAKVACVLALYGNLKTTKFSSNYSGGKLAQKIYGMSKACPNHPHPRHLASSPLSDHLHARPEQAAHRQVQGGRAPKNHLIVALKSSDKHEKMTTRSHQIHLDE